MDITTLTPQQLRNAADLQEKIDGLQGQLNSILGGGEIPTPAPGESPVTTEAIEAPTNGRRKKRKVSAEARARMAASQRARWAATRGEAVPEETPATEAEKPKKKRNISDAGRKAMSLAGKRRWAKARAEKRAEAAKKSQAMEAKLKALAKAREARWAKVRAAREAKA
jgi:hypothetical protein